MSHIVDVNERTSGSQRTSKEDNRVIESLGPALRNQLRVDAPLLSAHWSTVAYYATVAASRLRTST